jgi:hypothetical protein
LSISTLKYSMRPLQVVVEPHRGIATTRPSAVSTSASEIPTETAPIPAEPLAPMPWNALMTPTTGAEQSDERGRRADGRQRRTPFLRSEAVSAEAR